MTLSPHKQILCYLDNDYGRDAEILLPLVYFAEKYLSCKVKFAFIWDIHAIYREKPDLVLIANTIGSLWHYEISKYAKKSGIEVFALISEGNFRTDGSFNFYGYSYDKVYHQRYICHWSERTKKYFEEVMSQYNNVLTGALGFDRYKIYRFKSKEDFLSEKGLTQYKKVIGYAGWAFGKIYNKQGLREIRFLHAEPGKRIQWMKEQMLKVEGILKFAIESNPDILFLLKRHPNEANPSITKENPNEMIRLRDYPNVIYITENENIHDLINISDFWMAFESTTALEAWMLNKQTLLINPDPDFNRDKLYKGSVLIRNTEELQRNIKSFYETNELPGFKNDELEKNRKTLIKDTIGFDDGLNHLRAGFYLKKTVQETEHQDKNIVFSFRYFRMFFLMKAGSLFYNRNIFLKLPKFRKTVWIFDKYELKNIYKLKPLYYKYLDDFYKNNQLDYQIRDNSIWSKILNEWH